LRTAGCRKSGRNRSRPGSLRTEGQWARAMRATPPVVPTAKRSFWDSAVPTPASSGVPDTMAAKARKVPITTTLLAMGANIGTANLSWALSSPPATAAMP
jgi:hypothetical protein